ncbi:MAG: alkaline serine protease [Frankiales bacterium]|nr:alkaline serine protease [Frankiales bacterium]
MNTARRPVTLGLLAAVLGTCLAGALPAAASTAGTPAVAVDSTSASGTWLVATTEGGAAAVADSLRASGVEVLRQLDGVGVLSVRASSAVADSLRADPRVTGVSADEKVALQGSTWSPATDPGSLLNVTKATGARSSWSSTTGEGVDVALIDSGVSPVQGLDGADKLLQGPDLSFDATVPALRSLDGFGHGTHMAGIIAGRDATFTGAADTTSFAGVAPDARVISVKVADAYGNADVSQIIAGIDWVVQNRATNGMNIRVLNLSLGLPSGNGYKTDPLAHAAEQAWHKGIVVVASAGNNARQDGRLMSPAYDPYVIAVGASDSRGTLSTSDDNVPDFSSRGDFSRKPDIVAPGRSIAGLLVPGSYLDQQYGAVATVGDRFLRGSGTSQAAAVVSGSAALLLQKRPTLTPNQVKDVLRNTAEPLLALSTSQGEGQLRIDAALNETTLFSGQSHTKSNGAGSLDAARGGYRVESAGVLLTGEKDVFGKELSTGTHARAAASTTAWTGGSWNGSTMTGTAFTGTTWNGVAWTGKDWAGQDWSVRGSTPAVWDGRTWAGGYWAGRTWAGRTWAGRTWATGSWS